MFKSSIVLILAFTVFGFLFCNILTGLATTPAKDNAPNYLDAAFWLGIPYAVVGCVGKRDSFQTHFIHLSKVELLPIM